MELKEAIFSRRSIRKFKPDPVPGEHIYEMLEAARLAPSGSNLQPFRFVVIRSEKAREQLASATLKFVTEAPVVIACCTDLTAMDGRKERMKELAESGAFTGATMGKVNPADYADRWKDSNAIPAYLNLNTAIAIEHLILRATDLGLGTCWVMLFKQKEIKDLLDLGEQYAVVALIPVGYPDQDPGPRPRLPMEQILLKEI
ncbi:MAG: oxidoreductase [Peptococcaceae bacterium BRH_c4b]|nr:MAG: oxidoreductase [Peptococcaceae bacterium BRH_c4b]